jgi:hypothetical protein
MLKVFPNRSSCSIKNNQSLQPDSRRFSKRNFSSRISFHQSPDEMLSTRTSYLFQKVLFKDSTVEVFGCRSKEKFF